MIDFPSKLQFLFEPARYKVLYGGRGGAKSWGIATALLILGRQKCLRILCAREIQKSMRESVHQLLKDRIADLGLGEHYTVLNDEIRGANGTLIIFAGLRHNIDSIKSKEGIDIVWVEEATNVSPESWRKLIPTIRKEGSEIVVSFNPELDDDETYKRFVLQAPPGAVVRKIDWRDNPFFPEVLRSEMEHLKASDPDEWLNVYEGHCRHTLAGAVYAGEMRAATEEGRITKVPYDRSKPVHTFWDLGYSDHTSIWFAQIVGFEYRVVDFYQEARKGVPFFLQVLQSRGYIYDTDWLPHDGNSEQMAANGMSIAKQMRDAGRKVRVIPKMPIADGINAVRTMFPNMWFDAEKCADGLQCIRRYRYDVDQQTGRVSKNPLHDENSHAADALRYCALALKEPRKMIKVEAPKRLVPSMVGTRSGWMR